jgi:hypothetical protein
MSTSQGVQHPGSRLRRVAGAAPATLGVLVAVGVGVLMSTSLSASRALSSPSFSAPHVWRLARAAGTDRSAGPVARFCRSATGSSIDSPVPHRQPGDAVGEHGSPNAHQR